VISIRGNGVIVNIDQAACRLFGYKTVDEVMRQKINMLLPPPYKEQHDSYLTNYLNTGNRKIVGSVAQEMS
jgi:PAS domain S-box-containing protein